VCMLRAALHLLVQRLVEGGDEVIVADDAEREAEDAEGNDEFHAAEL